MKANKKDNRGLLALLVLVAGWLWWSKRVGAVSTEGDVTEKELPKHPPGWDLMPIPPPYVPPVEQEPPPGSYIGPQGEYSWTLAAICDHLGDGEVSTQTFDFGEVRNTRLVGSGRYYCGVMGTNNNIVNTTELIRINSE